MKRVIKAATADGTGNIFVWDGKSEIPGDVVNVRIEDGVTSIVAWAFFNCTDLKNIEIPNSVTSIGEDAFRDCKSLKNITIPNSVTIIGEFAFYHCDSLKNITIPNSITSIGAYVFARCKSLKNIEIPDSVTSIGEAAFYLCTSLESITIPNSVTSIDGGAFEYCTSLDDSTKSKIDQIRKNMTLKHSNKTKSTFTRMKKEYLAYEVDDLCYDSEYTDYINGLYHDAEDKLESKYPNLYIEPSIQLGVGGVFATYGERNERYYASWDFRSECEAIEAMVVDCKNEKQLVNRIADYLDSQLSSAELSDSDENDDDDLTML